MRVAICAFGERGGMLHYPVQLANGLSNHTSVTLLLPEGGIQRDNISDYVCTMPYSVPSAEDLGDNARKGFKIYQQLHESINKLSVDIIHHTFIGPIKPTMFLPLLRLEEGKLVATLHDPILKNGDIVEKKSYEIKNKISIQISDCTIVHGSATMGQAERAGYNLSKIKKIPHGKYDLFKDVEYTKNKPEENTILFFGSLRFDKGSDRILEILDEIQPEMPDITAIVAGSPGDIQSDYLCELERDDRIELYAEYIQDTKVGELFSRSSLVVLPYREATSSGVLMTAYAFEKPVVGTDVGDIGELIRKDNIGLCAENNNKKVAEAIVNLLSNKEVYNKKKKNIASEATKYAWENIGEKTTSLYRSILDESNTWSGRV